MPTYRVLGWREVPTQVEVRADDGTTVKRPMPRWFMQEVSRIALRDGLAGTDQYLAAFSWSEPVQREGSIEAVLEAVLSEQAAKFGRRPDGHPLDGSERYSGDGTVA